MPSRNSSPRTCFPLQLSQLVCYSSLTNGNICNTMTNSWPRMKSSSSLKNNNFLFFTVLSKNGCRPEFTAQNRTCPLYLTGLFQLQQLDERTNLKSGEILVVTCPMIHKSSFSLTVTYSISQNGYQYEVYIQEHNSFPFRSSLTHFSLVAKRFD